MFKLEVFVTFLFGVLLGAGLANAMMLEQGGSTNMMIANLAIYIGLLGSSVMIFRELFSKSKSPKRIGS